MVKLVSDTVAPCTKFTSDRATPVESPIGACMVTSSSVLYAEFTMRTKVGVPVNNTVPDTLVSVFLTMPNPLD